MQYHKRCCFFFCFVNRRYPKSSKRVASLSLVSIIRSMNTSLAWIVRVVTAEARKSTTCNVYKTIKHPPILQQRCSAHPRLTYTSFVRIQQVVFEFAAQVVKFLRLMRLMRMLLGRISLCSCPCVPVEFANSPMCKKAVPSEVCLRPVPLPYLGLRSHTL